MKLPGNRGSSASARQAPPVREAYCATQPRGGLTRGAHTLQHQPYRESCDQIHRPPDTQAHSTRLSRARHTRAQSDTCLPAPPHELRGRHPPASPAPGGSRPRGRGAPQSEFQRVYLQREGKGAELGPEDSDFQPPYPLTQRKYARPHPTHPASLCPVPLLFTQMLAYVSQSFHTLSHLTHGCNSIHKCFHT